MLHVIIAVVNNKIQCDCCVRDLCSFHWCYQVRCIYSATAQCSVGVTGGISVTSGARPGLEVQYRSETGCSCGCLAGRPTAFQSQRRRVIVLQTSAVWARLSSFCSSSRLSRYWKQSTMGVANITNIINDTCDIRLYLINTG